MPIICFLCLDSRVRRAGELVDFVGLLEDGKYLMVFD